MAEVSEIDGSIGCCAFERARYSQQYSILNAGEAAQEPSSPSDVRNFLSLPDNQIVNRYLDFASNVTAAHVAALVGDRKTLEAIALSTPRQLRKRDSTGKTPLDIAVKYGRAQTVSLLLAQGVKPNKGHALDLPIHVAAHFGHYEVLKTLIDHGAAIDARSRYRGETALHHAARSDFREIVDLLLSAGADPNEPNNDGSTALSYAAEKNADYVRVLLEHGADVRHRNHDGFTALHFATSGLTVDILVAHGAQVNAQASEGRTPLHVIVDRYVTWVPTGNSKAIDEYNMGLVGAAASLMEAGANPYLPDEKGISAIGAAQSQHKTALVEVLSKGE